MHKPTQDLGQEHGAILLFLQVAEVISKKLDASQPVAKTDLGKLVDFVRTFADKCHHGKEEGLVFPKLVQKSEAHADLVNKLLGEHMTGRDFIRGINNSIPGYAVGNSHAQHISRNLTGYADLLQKHIHTETEYLFPLMEKEFSQSEAEALWEGFEKIEHDVIGEGKHEAYHEWLKEMEKLHL